MNIVIAFAVGIGLFVGLVELLVFPFLIGKERKGQHTASDYLTILVGVTFPMISMAGRILKWW